MADTFFWGSDIFSRATRWLLVNTGTTFNLVLPLLLLLFGLALGQSHSQNFLLHFFLIQTLSTEPRWLPSISVVVFFSALGVGGLSSLGLLDRTEQAGTSMIQVKFPNKLYNATIKGRRIFDEEFSECRNKHREHRRTCRASKQKSGSARWARSLLQL